jgi:hypothetical protein
MSWARPHVRFAEITASEGPTALTRNSQPARKRDSHAIRLADDDPIPMAGSSDVILMRQSASVDAPTPDREAGEQRSHASHFEPEERGKLAALHASLLPARWSSHL